MRCAPPVLVLVLLPGVLFAGILLAGPARAEEPATADAVTEPGRSLERALDVTLGAPAAKRSLVLLIDPTPSLQAAGFVDALQQALARNADALKQTAVGVAVAGRKKPLVLAPTLDHGQVQGAVEALFEGARKAFRDVYAAARAVGSALAGRSGPREILLVTLENGDTEQDLEACVAALRRARVRLSVLASEAYLADSFWVSSSRALPRGHEPGSGDDAFLTLPWGWLFQQTIANETTPSGFAAYGLSRLAAATEGKVFLYAAPGGVHRCAYYGSCSFCAEDHLPADESFHAVRMRTIAPAVGSRAEAGKALARDPCFRALLKAWGQASKEGLLRSRPSVRLAGGGVKPERRLTGTWAPLLGNASGFRRLAGKGEKSLAACERIIAGLTSELEKLPVDGASRRYRAMADFTLAMLHVTRTNLVGYVAWCRDVAPALLGQAEHVVEPPELDPVLEGRRVSGISYTPLCLCHGVAPFRALHIPGGAAWDAALDQLEKVFDAYMRTYAHTPFAMALRHQGLARFTFTYRGTTTPPPPRPKPGSSTDTPTTETARPDRHGAGTTGGGSGAPTTGGG